MLISLLYREVDKSQLHRRLLSNHLPARDDTNDSLLYVDHCLADSPHQPEAKKNMEL